jgi:C-terminal processing protease CtpA/Prc
VSKLKQQRNQVVTFPGDTVKMDKVRPFPVKVAIITNENTASTAELFILQARQSRKVAIFGQPTMGSVTI